MYNGGVTRYYRKGWEGIINVKKSEGKGIRGETSVWMGEEEERKRRRKRRRKRGGRLVVL